MLCRPSRTLLRVKKSDGAPTGVAQQNVEQSNGRSRMKNVTCTSYPHYNFRRCTRRKIEIRPSTQLLLNRLYETWRKSRTAQSLLHAIYPSTVNLPDCCTICRVDRQNISQPKEDEASIPADEARQPLACMLLALACVIRDSLKTIYRNRFVKQHAYVYVILEMPFFCLVECAHSTSCVKHREVLHVLVACNTRLLLTLTAA